MSDSRSPRLLALTAATAFALAACGGDDFDNTVLCAYPKVARYSDSGSLDFASSLTWKWREGCSSPRTRVSRTLTHVGRQRPPLRGLASRATRGDLARSDA